MAAGDVTGKTLTKNMSVKVPIEQVWEAFKSLHQLLPRLLPGFVDSAAIVEAPFHGGVGSVRDCRFNPDVPGISHSKEKIEEVDDAGHVFVYSVIEGEVLEIFQSYRVTWSFSPDLVTSGTSVTWTAEVVPHENSGSSQDGRSDKSNSRSLPEEDIFSESATLLVKQLEEHLAVTGEFDQPSFKESLRNDLLFS